jgi:hypothetical protein
MLAHAREEIHEEADHLGVHDRGDANRCRGAGARTELGVGARRCHPMKSKPNPPAAGTVTVKVTNWREADLVELQVVESGSANWKKVLGALKAGQWTWAKLPQGKNCHVNLRGKYADGKSADVSNVDICADKTVDLVN